jgi:predicted Zn-dependent peptidase
VVVAAAGNLEHERVVDLVREHLGDLTGQAEPPVHEFPHASVDTLHYTRPTEQVNFCVGVPAFGQFDEDKYPLAILDTVLGGSMGSRLFQEIREKRGLAYSVGTYAAVHREGGYFCAYGGTSPDTYELCLDLVRQEFVKVRDAGVTEAEIERAKAQYRSGIVMKQESMSSRMNRMGASEVYFNRVIPLEEVLESINRVTNDDIRRVAAQIFPADMGSLTVAAVGPFKKARASRAKKTASKNGDAAAEAAALTGAAA